MDKRKRKIKRTAHEKMLLALSFGTVIWILPFTLYRFYRNEWLIAVVDLVVAVSMAFIFIFVYKTSKVKIVSIALILIAIVGNIISFYIKGVSQIYWVYPAMLVAYYLIDPNKGVILNSFLLLFYLPKLYTSIDSITFSTILITVIITNIIAYVFASSLRKQEAILLKFASEDYLTSTGNRRALDESIQKLHAQLKNHDLTASLVLLDIDNFKNINDQFGHIVGDQVLVNLSTLLKDHCHQNTEIFRYGGEEFLVLCKHFTLKDTYKMAEQYRRLVKNKIQVKNNSISISIGVAEYIKEESIKDWIHRVDLALYQAKNQGKDRTIKA